MPGMFIASIHVDWQAVLILMEASNHISLLMLGGIMALVFCKNTIYTSFGLRFILLKPVKFLLFSINLRGYEAYYPRRQSLFGKKGCVFVG